MLHWGADLGELSERALLELRRGAGAVQDGNGLDENRPIAIVPEYSAGWFGLPGLSGHRDGQDFSASFRITSVAQTDNTVVVDAADTEAGLTIRLTVELTDSGLVRAKADLTNTGATPYTVDGLVLALPVPTEATELLDLTGRTSVSGTRSGTRSRRARTSATTAAGAPAPTRRCCCWPGPRASASRTARSGPCTPHGAATTARTPSAA
ncbi:hypothetical protein GCM10029976_037690 [Kribbella albertanoniae]